MTYKVRKGGVIKQQTNHKSCLPSPTVLREMERAGYRIYINGKRPKKEKQSWR